MTCSFEHLDWYNFVALTDISTITNIISPIFGVGFKLNIQNLKMQLKH